VLLSQDVLAALGLASNKFSAAHSARTRISSVLFSANAFVADPSLFNSLYQRRTPVTPGA